MIEALKILATVVAVLIGLLLPVLILIASIKVIGRMRADRDEIDAMDDEDDTGPPLDVEPERDEPGLEYESAERTTEWDEYRDEGEVPANVRRPEPHERMVTLRRGTDVFQIDLARAALIDAGIWAFVLNDTNALAPVGLARVTLAVPEGDRDRAEALVYSLEHNDRTKGDATTH